MAVHDRSDQICIDVIEAIATVTDSDPLTMEPPLYDVVDTDALETLYRSGTDLTIEFDYDGHDVVIDGDQTVTVDGEVA